MYRKWGMFSHLHTKIGNFCINISLKIEDCNVQSLTTQSHLIFGYIQYIYIFIYLYIYISRTGATSFWKSAKIPQKLFLKNGKLMDQRY
jgi:hypothetical protein